jgi:hypothetical protein
LDPETHTLRGHEVITYHNRTSDVLPYLVFHLYLNAFRDGRTTFMRESGHRVLRFPGWTQVDTLSLSDGSDLLPTSSIDETLMTTTLPQPLLPGETVTLTLEFHAQLPRVIARTGYVDDLHLLGQWFPKLSVYREGRGWNAYQFHANSEFFADFGTYDVSITVPPQYVVGATGQATERKKQADGTVTHGYHAEAVIDFAWVAWPQFQELRRKVGPVEVLLLYAPGHEGLTDRYLDVAESTLKAYGEWYGPYPYPRLTLIDVPENTLGAGGMEYPTLVMLDSMANLGIPFAGTTLFPEFVAAHEIAHQWWQSTVATNEFEEPWLDEGLAEYSGSRFIDLVYAHKGPLLRVGPVAIGARDLDRATYLALDPATPMAGRAWEFRTMEYQSATYSKPSTVYTTMERLLGEEKWLQVLRTYYQRFQFRHPTADDLLDVLAEVGGEQAHAYFEPLVYGRELVDYAVTGLECQKEGPGYRCSVSVSRLEDAILPVEVLITFSDGDRIIETWEGRERHREYVYTRPNPVSTAEIDPEQKVFMDVSIRNNSLTRTVQAKPIARISSQWFYWLEQLILTLGGLW